MNWDGPPGIRMSKAKETNIVNREGAPALVLLGQALDAKG
jgi:hypothetical protein